MSGSKRSLHKLLASALLATFTLIPPVSADDGAQLIRVEEDWVALIRNPDASTGAPQILNVISPDSTLSGAFGMIEINHASAPEFQEGGMQVQSWIGDSICVAALCTEQRSLEHDYDRLEYTVAMEQSGETLTFELGNVRSQTWGHTNSIEIRCPVERDKKSLEGYDPEFSVANSNVNVGAHRVEIMYLRETRYIYDDGTVQTDDTMRVIHRYHELVEDVSVEEYDRHPEYYNISITE